MARRLTVVQMLPALDAGGVEKGTLEVGRYLVAQGHRSIVIAAGGRMAARLVAEGSEHLAWDVGAKRLSTLRLVRPLRAFLARERPDILHLRSRLPAWIGYWAWKQLPPASRPHLVTTVHGPYTPGRYSAVMVRGERVIAISRMIHDYILAHYPKVDPEVIRIIPRGVDPYEYPWGYKPAPEWRREFFAALPGFEGRFVVTLPARLTRWKGQEDFIEVMAALRARGVAARGLIVGEPHPRKRAFERHLHDLVARRGLGDIVRFVGHRADLREVLAASSAVVSASRAPEAFGRVTLEALALGVPVVAYDHGGVGEQLAEIYPEGRVPPGDWRTLAERLAGWAAHGAPPVPRQQPFTLLRMLSSTLEVYRELAGR
jgi:glycosyltransferase involved in cell wall biosynthesis